MSTDPEKPLVLVTWLDIVSSYPWDDGDATDLQPIQIRTVGWLALSDNERVVVSSSIDTEGKTGGTWSIPRGCVKMVEYL